MTEIELRGHLARALGREISGVGELRLARILFGVLLPGGVSADLGVIAACDIYGKLMAEGMVPAAPPALIDVARLALAEASSQ